MENKELQMNEHKIAVLFALKTMGIAFSNRQLIEILSEADIIELLLGLDFIYYFQEFDMVKVMNLGGVEHFKITNKGRETCTLFEEKLPKEIRQRIESVCQKILIGEHNLHKTWTKIEPLRENLYLFKCGAMEHNEPTFEITVRTSDEAQIWHMSEHFRKNSTKIYEQLMQILEVATP